ncbi:MAG: histone deacetylase family protein [Lysobacter sp.]
MRLYTHPACLAHQAGNANPESPARLAAVIEAIDAAWPELSWHQAPPATRSQLLRVHHNDLLSLVLDTPIPESAGPFMIDADTALSGGSADAALHAAGAGIAAVDALMVGHARRAFCAVRPPGHHAGTAVAMGFCLFNNVAVAAAHALEKHGLARVAIIDFDVHHGNGTQQIFDRDARVMYLSSHQAPLYPGTGAANEHGVGNMINRPLPPGTGSQGFRDVWGESLLPTLNGFRPQMVFVSAGFDGDRRDPLAALELEPDDFRWLTAKLVKIADTHASGRIMSTLEGGYDLTALRECSVAHVDALLSD